VIFDIQLDYKHSHMLHSKRFCGSATTNMAMIQSFVVIHIEDTFNVSTMCTEVITYV